MAKRNNRAVTSLNLILVLSLLLMISILECGKVRFRFKVQKDSIECDSVYGAEADDTCSGIIQKYSLNADFFSAINPNFNCDKIFVGEWLCINGKVNKVVRKFVSKQ